MWFATYVCTIPPSLCREDDHVTAEPALLTVEALAKSFGGVRALDGVSFSVAQGELVGLIGPNGSGKTTAFNLSDRRAEAERRPDPIPRRGGDGKRA